MAINKLSISLALFTALGALIACEITPQNSDHPTNASEAKAYLNNKTNLFQYPDGTTELEYTAADGTSYYWVPLNKKIIVGEWRIAERGGDYEICFRYPTGSIEYYQILANETNWGVWDCSPGNALLEDGLERVEGNPLNLKAGSVPFVIEFETAYDFASIAQEMSMENSSFNFLPVYQKK